MYTRDHLKVWVYEAIQHHGGEARLLDVAKYIWHNHERELQDSGDLFFKWQYDMRWAANVLRHENKLLRPKDTKRGYWAIKPDSE